MAHGEATTSVTELCDFHSGLSVKLWGDETMSRENFGEKSFTRCNVKFLLLDSSGGLTVKISFILFASL